MSARLARAPLRRQPGRYAGGHFAADLGDLASGFVRGLEKDRACRILSSAPRVSRV